MQKVISRTLQLSFWLSLLLHLLCLLGFSITLIPFKTKEKPPGLIIPAYLYQPREQVQSIQNQAQQMIKQSKKSQSKAIPLKKITTISKAHQSLQQVKRVALKKNLNKPIKFTQAVNISEPTEPVHLIGDKNIQKPLFTLIGKALTQHLVYPKIAIDFNIRGMSVIGFVLYPDGTVKDTRLVKSSGAGILDEEAVRAVSAISPLMHVSEYVPAPKYLVIGIIFR